MLQVNTNKMGNWLIISAFSTLFLLHEWHVIGFVNEGVTLQAISLSQRKLKNGGQAFSASGQKVEHVYSIHWDGTKRIMWNLV